MSIAQIIFTVVLIAALLGLAGYYAWRQGQTLRRLRTADDLTPDDHRYLHRQAWRRLAGSGLMILFAGLLAGSFFIEGRDQELADREFLRFWVGYWIVVLLGVLVILGLAAFDFLATRRYGLRHYRQLQADRRSMLEREIATLRRERNGHG